MAGSEMKRNMVGAVAGILLMIAVAVGLRFGLAPELLQRNSGYRQVMGTVAQITAVAEDEQTAKRAVEAGWDALVRVDELMSTYKPNSDISRINSEAADGPVKVDSAVIEVLQAAKRYSELTGGAFDVTVGPEIQLWRQAEKKGELPSDEEIAAVRERVGYEKLLIDQAAHTVEFAVKGMKIDLGAIAKGYGIDAAVEAMKDADAVGGLVDVGGDIRVFGARQEKGQPGVWQIGLQNPQVEKGLMLTLELSDTAVATSGDYRRYVEIGGKRYSHIFSPKEGASAKELTSVSVFAKKAIDADALATSVSVIGLWEGFGLIENLEGVEAIVMKAGEIDELGYTSGAREFVVE